MCCVGKFAEATRCVGVASGLILYFPKLAQFSEKVVFAWGPAFVSDGSGILRTVVKLTAKDHDREL